MRVLFRVILFLIEILTLILGKVFWCLNKLFGYISTGLLKVNVWCFDTRDEIEHPERYEEKRNNIIA